MRKKFITFILVLSTYQLINLSTALRAGELGTAGLNFLKISIGAKGIAMGESGTAITDDIYAIYWNPAGLTKIQSAQVALMYNRWFEDISSQWFAYAQPTAIGNFAASINYLGMKDFSGYDASGAKTSSVGANDLALGLSYARTLYQSANSADRLFGGINLKYIREKLEEVSADGLAADFGLLYNCGARFSEELGGWTKGLSVGIVYQNLGQGIKFDQEITPFPQIFRLGFGYIANQLNLALDIVSAMDNKSYFTLGGEYWLDKLFALRIGYRGGNMPVAGLRAGLGIKIPQEILSWGLGDILFDYAWSGFASLGDTHRFSLKIEFAQPEEKEKISLPVKKERREKEKKKVIPPVAVAEKTVYSDQIATYFKEARIYKKKGYLLHALDRYYRVLELEPENKTAKEKVYEIQTNLENILVKRKNLTPKERYCVEGFVYYEQGKLTEAVSAWEKTLKIEFSSEKLVLEDKVTNEYLNKIRKILTEEAKNKQIQNLMQSGLANFQNKKYKEASALFSEILKLDLGNKQAKEYLEKCKLELEKMRKPKIVEPKEVEKVEDKIVPPPEEPKIDPAEIEKHYRQGLIYYGNGQLESAMKEFEFILKLDPKHEKAEQALEKIKKELKLNNR